jgi:hypothetical protein
MTADEIMQRLAELSVEIERHQTAIWLADREREELRRKLRRALIASPGEASQPLPGDQPRAQALTPVVRPEPPAGAQTYHEAQPLIGAGPIPAPPGLPPPRRTVY